MRVGELWLEFAGAVADVLKSLANRRVQQMAALIPAITLLRPENCSRKWWVRIPAPGR
jgi:hypothetical protein